MIALEGPIQLRYPPWGVPGDGPICEAYAMAVACALRGKGRVIVFRGCVRLPAAVARLMLMRFRVS